MKKVVLAIGSLICLGGLVGCEEGGSSDTFTVKCAADICKLNVYTGDMDGIVRYTPAEPVDYSITMENGDTKTISFPIYNEMSGYYTKVVVVNNYYETSNVEEYACTESRFILKTDKTYEAFENDIDTTVSASLLY